MSTKKKVQTSHSSSEADQSPNKHYKKAHTLYTDVSICKSRLCYAEVLVVSEGQSMQTLFQFCQSLTLQICN